MIAQSPRTDPHGSTSLANYFHDVYCPLRSDELSSSTRDVYMAAFSRLGQHVGREAMICDMTSETVAAFMLWLVNRGRSPATSNSYRNSLLAMWRFAIEHGHVDSRPDMSIIREFRSHDVEEHRAEKAAAEAPQPLSPQMSLRAFLAEYSLTADMPRTAIERTRWAVASLDKWHSRPVAIAELSDVIIDRWFQQRIESGLGEVFVNEQRIAVLRLWQTAFGAGLTSTMPRTPVVMNRQRFKTKSNGSPVIPLDADATFGEEMKIGHLISYFLNWQEGRIAESRMHGTRFYLRDFEEHFGEMTIAEFRPGACARVDQWIKSHKGWNGCRASVVSRLKQLFSWAKPGHGTRKRSMPAVRS